MLRIFLGMILGSLTTLLLLGGQAAADRMFANIQHLADQHASSGLSMVWLGLFVGLTLGLSSLAAWRTKAMTTIRSVVSHVRRVRHKRTT
ncbi:MAG: hypothetical protein D6690_13040 [Nitrospirae bacterium]|nr:MAG: hypothetical protein D6690_13040 [Nitrospirota bacterium]